MSTRKISAPRSHVLFTGTLPAAAPRVRIRGLIATLVFVGLTAGAAGVGVTLRTNNLAFGALAAIVTTALGAWISLWIGFRTKYRRDVAALAFALREMNTPDLEELRAFIEVLHERDRRP